MSTILDALRKAQEETGDKRQPPVGEHPVATEAVAPSPRARRRIGWPVAVVGILALAFAGGLAFGDRIAALLGNGADSDAPAAPADAQVASRDDGAPAAPAAPDVKQKSADPAVATPVVRRGKPRTQGKAPASDAPVLRTQEQAAAADAGSAAAPAAGPTPYGQLHVFGAGERPAGNKPSNEDRLARLQQLRDKMLKARQDASARGPQAEAPAAPAQIFVPPPREASPAQAAAAATGDAPDAPAANEAARGAAGEPAGIAPPAEPADAAPVEVARADVPPPADRASDPVVAEPAEPAVGVSVTNAHADAAEAEVQDPDIPPAHEAPAAEAESPTTVAAVASTQPAPAAAARSGAAAPVVLRRAPGGVPQVAINILQWSAEPGRRFAFVSVDGGNMTQVREGDHIAGLTIKHIHQQMIEFGFNDSTFLLRAN